MRFTWFRLIVAVYLSNFAALAQELPQWSSSDLELLESGELVVGSDLFLEGDVSVLSEYESKASRYFDFDFLQSNDTGVELDSKFIPAYLNSLTDKYVNDPQKLLNLTEVQDLEAYIESSTSGAAIKMYISIFDQDQLLPIELELEHVTLEESYLESDAVIVYYFIGSPMKSQIRYLSQNLNRPFETSKVMQNAIIKAKEKSNPLSQFKAFTKQLSISLYWLEGSIVTDLVDTTLLVEEVEPVVVATSTGQSVGRVLYASDRNLVICFIAVLVSVVAFTYILLRNKRSYVFPLLDSESRLGAGYGAGIGAVMLFQKHASAPSKQSDLDSDQWFSN